MTTWEICIIDSAADMERIYQECADLIEGINQLKDSDETEISSAHLLVRPDDVGEAVRRLNALGYETDEDPKEY